MSYLKDREIWLSNVPTGNPPAGYFWKFIQNGKVVVRDSNGNNQIMVATSGSQAITGSLIVTEGITGTISSASYVDYSNIANKPTLVSGSSQISFEGLVDKPTLISGSDQIRDFDIFATTGSNQFNGNQIITGSLTTTGTIVAQTLNVQQVTSSIVYSSGSNTFGNSSSDIQQFTGSLAVTGAATFSSRVGVGGAAATYSLTAYNASNGTTAAFGGTARGIRIDNDGTFSSGRSTIFGVDSSFYGSYQPLSIEASSIALQAVTGGNVGIGKDNPSTRLNVIKEDNGGGGIGRFEANNRTQYVEIGYQNINQWASVPSNAQLTFSVNDTERMRITSGGNVVIGNTVASNVGLTIYGTNAATIYQTPTSGTGASNGLYVGQIGDVSYIWNYNNFPTVFATNNTERVRITAGGNVGINSTSPFRKLQIDGDTGVRNGSFFLGNESGSADEGIEFYKSGNTIRIYKNGGAFGGTYSAGSVNIDLYDGTTDYSTRISGDGNSYFNRGFVGIGTNDPGWKLTVEGTTGTSIQSPLMALRVTSATHNNGILFINSGNTASYNDLGGIYANIQSGNAKGYLGFYTRNSDGTNSDVAERMRISSQGYVTKPYQPSFRAGRSASYAPGANSNIVFNSVFFNTGGHYNATTGLFTAPIAGVYYFSASVIWESLTDGQAMDDAFDIRVNGGLVAYDFRRGEYVAGTTGNGGYYVTNANVLVNLAANDNVSIRNLRSLTVHGNFYFTWFAGYLLG